MPPVGIPSRNYSPRNLSRVAKKNGKYGFIYNNSKVLSDFIYDEITITVYKYYYAKKDGKTGIIDDRGSEITGFVFDEIQPINEKYILCKQGDKFFYYKVTLNPFFMT